MIERYKRIFEMVFPAHGGVGKPQKLLDPEPGFKIAIAIDSINIMTKHQYWPLKNRIPFKGNAVFPGEFTNSFQKNFEIVIDYRFADDTQFILNRFFVGKSSKLIGRVISELFIARQKVKSGL